MAIKSFFSNNLLGLIIALIVVPVFLLALFFLDPISAFVLLLLMSITVLSFYLMGKIKDNDSLNNKTMELQSTINDLDNQAKLIIKNDVELRLYQQRIEEEVEKLTLIKNLIISSIHTLDKEKLFSQISQSVINTLGFRKGLLLDFESLDTKVSVGFKQHEIDIIKEAFKYKKESLQEVHLVSPKSEIYQHLTYELQIKDILIAPINVRESIDSIFMVGDFLLTKKSKKSEEAFLIICMYLSQCLNNIDLFEGLYHTKDELEKRIKQRTSELVKSLRDIESISKIKTDFISSVSHELRTPLTSVKGFSSLLVDEKFGKLPQEAKKRLSKIDQNVNKLMAIVNTLLDISRIESGKMEVKIVPAELTKLIRDVADFLNPQTSDKQIELSLEIPDNMNVYMDKNLIERVFINLINNAIKFTPQEGKITVGVKQENNTAVVSVKDTGCGISKDDLEKVFQEFFRVNNPQTASAVGSGLGLSLVKRIIDTHKEKIWVESEVGKGTTFYFTLHLDKNG